MSEFCLHWYGRNIVHRLKYTRHLRSCGQLPSRLISKHTPPSSSNANPPARMRPPTSGATYTPHSM
ncbi:hypothetical protein FIBSPDRAFT_231343 [Athelia psychrophila]|uniref:Uncharacterized protein n=1 Tax=Athelia psychrophila TaxID=1759441 RepID=A0A165YLI8_9AGAM|nr:hypothetical protein FIBSPDRAFT_231343 [Fibularhizoctonia sp. CBS 109695]